MIEPKVLLKTNPLPSRMPTQHYSYFKCHGLEEEEEGFIRRAICGTIRTGPTPSRSPVESRLRLFGLIKSQHSKGVCFPIASSVVYVCIGSLVLHDLMPIVGTKIDLGSMFRKVVQLCDDIPL